MTPRHSWWPPVLLLGACATEAPPTAPASASEVGADAAPTHPAGVIELTVPMSGVPYGVAISRNGKILLSTNIGGSDVVRANLPNRTSMTSITVGFTPPGHLTWIK